jgi:hypothetical protein
VFRYAGKAYFFMNNWATHFVYSNSRKRCFNDIFKLFSGNFAPLGFVVLRHIVQKSQSCLIECIIEVAHVFYYISLLLWEENLLVLFSNILKAAFCPVLLLLSLK